MRDYSELVKAMRYCSEHDNCGSRCPRFEKNEDCVDELTKDAADAIEELLKEVQSRENDCINLTGECATYYAQIPHWISVEERVPEPGERVLISNGAFVCESFISQSGKWQRGGTDLFFMTPTHWMPLPEPPKEDAE